MKLRELIRAVRNCKTAAEEDKVIAKECAFCRTAFAGNGTSTTPVSLSLSVSLPVGSSPGLVCALVQLSPFRHTFLTSVFSPLWTSL
jgi:hypothetical protein